MDDVAPNPDQSALRLVACPRPFSIDRIDRMVPVGLTVLDMMRQSGMDPELGFYRVFLGDQLVPREHWRLRPKAGTILTIRAIPTGGDKNALRIVATIAIIAAAFFTQQYWVGPLASGLGVITGTAGAIGIASASMAGSLAINALIPPPRRRQKEAMPDAA